MSAEPRPCGACGAPGRPYLGGILCDTHAPWAVAGREDPAVQAARARDSWPEEWHARAARPMPVRARTTDPSTSGRAAASVTNVTETRERILEVLKFLEDTGATDEQIADMYESRVRAGAWRPVSPSGLRTRRAELVDLGMVRDSGRTRVTASGRRSIVWRVVA